MTTGGPVRVLVADDQALVRAGLATLLDSQPDLEVVGQAGDGREATWLARELTPRRGADGHPDAGAGRAGRHPADRRSRATASRAAPIVKVIVLTTYDLDEYVYEALRAGACGFLLKHAPPEELLLGVRAAADGGALLSPPSPAGCWPSSPLAHRTGPRASPSWPGSPRASGRCSTW